MFYISALFDCMCPSLSNCCCFKVSAKNTNLQICVYLLTRFLCVSSDSQSFSLMEMRSTWGR